MSDVNRLAFAVAVMLALSAAPAQAQTYAPAPRALAPVVPAPSDVCAPAPQGQGSASPQCRQECSRNPKYSPHCPQAAAPAPAPNWGAPPAANPAPAMGAAPHAPGTAAQFGGSLAPGQPAVRPGATKEARPSLPAVQNANAGAAKVDRTRPSALPAPAAAPVNTRSGVDACQSPADVDACRRQCAEALASSPSCPPPTTFDYCSVSPASAVCQQFCQQMNGQYSPACPNAPKPQQTASQGGAAAPGATGGAAPPAGGGVPATAGRGPTMALAPALAPQASSTLPGSQPPPRLSGANAVAPINCDAYLALGGEPRFDSVDGQPRGVVFTPGKSVTIKGCGFGQRKGSVVLNGSSGGLSNLALLVHSWSDTAITVQVDPKLGGVMDQASVEVVVSRSDGRRLQQTGHAFEAARESTKVASLPAYALGKAFRREVPGEARPHPRLVSPAPSGAALLVETPSYIAKTQFCPSEYGRDVLTLAHDVLPLRNGFVLERVDVRDITNRDWKRGDHGEDAGFEWHRQNALSVTSNLPAVQVVPSWMGLYRKRDALREVAGALSFGAFTAVTMAVEQGKLAPGASMCWSSYELDVYVKGPRGLAPL